jgi:molybdopterin converting factor small subunit
MIYRIQAYANLRHYLPSRQEYLELAWPEPVSIAFLLDHLGIPVVEIMQIRIGDQLVDRQYVPNASDIIELFPVLAGG